MCVGENNATRVAEYLNLQIGTLWENAVDCVKRQGTGLKPDDSHKYSFALAEFYYGSHQSTRQPSKGDMLFYASFGKPTLEFICNHTAILHLYIYEGHYNTDLSKVTSEIAPAILEHNRSFGKDTKLSFRVPFETSYISSPGSKFGKGHYAFSLHTFDYSKAELLSVVQELEPARQALSFYLSQYLQLLDGAGRHIFFSLPNFDDDRLRLSIDFSVASHTLLDIDKIQGISSEKINASLSVSWLKAAMLAGSANVTPAEHLAISLAEYRSTWLSHGSDVHFQVKLGPLRLKSLCNQEAVVLISVDEVTFFDTEDLKRAPRQRYTDWEIALLTNVVPIIEEDGTVIGVKLELNSSRFVPGLSHFTRYVESDKDASRYWSLFVTFITTRYLSILESAQYHIVYFNKSGDLWPQLLGPSEDVPDMHGFDQITTITQTAINEYFWSTWSGAQNSKSVVGTALASWSYNNLFSADFAPPTVRLLEPGDNGIKAIVWIHLRKGHLKGLRDWKPWTEGEQYSFEDCHLAFETELKIADHDELKDLSLWASHVEDSFVYKEHGAKADRILKHICLDLHSLNFLNELSRVDTLFKGKDKRPIEKLQALLVYVQAHYFPHLISTGLHVLHTVPVWNTGAPSLPSNALTKVEFHIHSKAVVHGGQVAKEAVIVIPGTVGSRQLPPPHGRQSWLDKWVVYATKGKLYGSVALSKRLFLGERLLSVLSHVNAITTLVPLPFSLRNGGWNVQLTTWAEGEAGRGGDSKWELDKEISGVLQYKWQHVGGWVYHYKGNDVGDHRFSVTSVTNNTLHIPTDFQRDITNIKLHGEVILRLEVAAAAQSWSAQSSATWAATVGAYSEAGGLQVKIISSVPPSFEKSRVEGNAVPTSHTDPESLLRSNLRVPESAELGQVLSEFKTFEGIWQSVYPGTSAYDLTHYVIEKNGDLLFELRPYPQLLPSEGLIQRTSNSVVDVVHTPQPVHDVDIRAARLQALGELTAKTPLKPPSAADQPRTSSFVEGIGFLQPLNIKEKTVDTVSERGNGSAHSLYVPKVVNGGRHVTTRTLSGNGFGTWGGA
ncbi:hypothetical protein PHLCEN_2v8772 [Hermanssonia centrifuga]|uniref:Uncharacterized protein n=1 Tax=Hermanssonia centrifuga TaxID=98765 RepID=A0A2R6NSF4_9APHY|nr:hypothetical protein PHLCEN_2v8772 [Hermanssonia centrifuga]